MTKTDALLVGIIVLTVEVAFLVIGSNNTYNNRGEKMRVVRAYDDIKTCGTSLTCKHKNDKIIKDSCTILAKFKHVKEAHKVLTYGNSAARREMNLVASICATVDLSVL